jgi:hypothetical protein
VHTSPNLRVPCNRLGATILPRRPGPCRAAVCAAH